MDSLGLELPTFQEENIGRAVIRDPSQFTIFERDYQGVRKLLVGGQILQADNIYAQVDETSRAETLEHIDALFRDTGYGPAGGSTVQMEVYKPFAFSHGFTKETKHGDTAILISDLNDEQRVEWGKYLNSIEFTQNHRELLSKAINLVLFPSVTTKYKPGNVALATELERIKRKIVLQLLPNISDEEAVIALGQRYTADIVRATPTPEWFSA